MKSQQEEQLLKDRFERSLEAVTKSETYTMQQDDISDAVKDENQLNIEMGVTASGQADWGVYQAQASANLGLESTTQTSSEVAHKNTRQQSERISSEIRKSFKTTFRTTVDIQDTSSHRHVIQNTTDKLINYEFRRKMRRVAVQVQHIGTYLSWQVYVDEPGRDLGVAELVHVAKTDDMESSVQPPEAPARLKPVEKDFRVEFPYEMIHDCGEDLTDDYIEGVEEDGDILCGRTRIIWQRQNHAPPPGHGYKLSNISILSIERANPQEDTPTVSPKIDTVGDNRFQISLPLVNFGGQANIPFVLKLIWIS